MYCPNCQKTFGDDEKICPECGRPLTAGQPAGPSAPADSNAAENPSAITEGADSAYLSSLPPDPPDPPDPSEPPEPPGKKRRRGWLIALIAAIAAVLLIGGFAAVSASGILVTMFGSPFEQISAAAQKTVKSGSFHLEATVNEHTETSFQPTVDVTQTLSGDLLLNLKKRQIEYYFAFDPDSRIAMRDGIVLTGINTPVVNENGEILTDSSGSPVCQFTADRKDISEDLEDFFFEYRNRPKKPLFERDKGVDFEEIRQELKDLFDTEINLSDYLIEDEVNQALETLKKDCGDEAWLEEYMGYEKTVENGADYVNFTPDMEKFCRYLKDLINPCLVSGYRENFTEAMDQLIYAFRQLGDNLRMTVRFGIRDNCLTEIRIAADAEQDTVEYYPYSNATMTVHQVEHTEISIVLSEIGKARPDGDAIDRLDADVREYLDQNAGADTGKEKKHG